MTASTGGESSDETDAISDSELPRVSKAKGVVSTTSDARTGQLDTNEHALRAKGSGERDSVAEMRKNDHAVLGHEANARLGRQLKELYDEVANGPVPDRFIELLSQLEQQKKPR